MPKKPSKPEAEVAQRMNPALFYANSIEEIDKEVRIYSNSVKLVRRLSSGVICIDWVNGGGFVPSITGISGEEQSGKTTSVYHALASSLSQGIPFNVFWDAEGTLSPEYSGNIFEPFGYDIRHLLDHPEEGFRYYRDNIIERLFNWFVKQLKRMPDKKWYEEAGTWAYVIPKRDDYFKRLMDAFELKQDKSLTNDHFYVCPTDNDGVEGFIALDSWASLVAASDDENEEMSKQRAVEPAVFSKHIKRVASLIGDKQVIMQGTNQTRKIPGQTYGDPIYEPGGEAIKFFTAQRNRIRSGAVPSGFERDSENGSLCVESSVEVKDGQDKYAFKAMKNTKNKFGVPGLKTHLRVWVADAYGNPRGYDPYFDCMQYLLNTNQVTYDGRKETFTFNLRDSMGKALAGKLREHGPIPRQAVKMLTIGEQSKDMDLIKRGAKLAKISFNPKLREACFKQLNSGDRAIYLVKSKLKKEKTTDYEEI